MFDKHHFMCDSFNKIKNITHRTNNNTHYNIIVSTYDQMKNNQIVIADHIASSYPLTNTPHRHTLFL